MYAPFARSRIIMSALAAAYAMTDKNAIIKALAGIPTYTSRGHGGKHRAQAHFGFAFSQRGQTSKYQPHQGKQEIARRLAHI
jgi:hypothetical protein